MDDTKLHIIVIAAVCMALLPIAATEQQETSVTKLDETYKEMPSAEQKDDEGRPYKPYKYEGVDFKVYRLTDGKTISVEGLGLSGNISVNIKGGNYLASTPVFGIISQTADTPKGALHIVCRRIVEKAKGKSDEELRKGLSDFYDELGKSETKPD